MSKKAEESAQAVLTALPLLMRFVKTQMRSHREEGLGVPAFRTLVEVSRNPGCSLGDLATRQGISAPTMSKLIDGLEERFLVTRAPSAEDRRRVVINLTLRGRRAYEKASAATREALAARLEECGDEDHEALLDTMDLLSRLVCAPAPEESD